MSNLSLKVWQSILTSAEEAGIWFISHLLPYCIHFLSSFIHCKLHLLNGHLQRQPDVGMTSFTCWTVVIFWFPLNHQVAVKASSVSWVLIVSAHHISITITIIKVPSFYFFVIKTELFFLSKELSYNHLLKCYTQSINPQSYTKGHQNVLPYCDIAAFVW